MLVVYDKKGTIYYAGIGYPQPEGIPFLNVEVPEGHYLDSIDVSQEPNKPVFKEYPKSEMDILKEKVDALEKQNAALIEGVGTATA